MEKVNLKLGVIGLSDGNGHPYSWSAIFNGYDPKSMEECGFPVIPRYLEQQIWPESTIKNATVCGIWTQDIELSQKVAKASLIDNIYDTPEKMVNHVDALLLARDDAENHFLYAEPYIRSGKPVYIDKPIALSLEQLKRLYELEVYPGQIFTCSALRYSDELKLTETDVEDVGDILEIHAVVPNSWDKYSVHILEPVLKMLSADDVVKSYDLLQGGVLNPNSRQLNVYWESGIVTRFFTLSKAVAPINIRVYGTRGWKELSFTDSFSAFRAALKDFVDGIATETIRSPMDFNLKVVDLIEKGR